MLGGVNIKKLSHKRKLWLDRRNRHLQFVKQRHNKKKKVTGFNNYIMQRYGIKKDNKLNFVAPRVFSLKDNPEETIVFFEKIINRRNSQRTHTSLFIDSSKVDVLDITAIMYLVAIIRDVHRNKVHRCRFEGNLPDNEEARRVFINSGFLDYVHVNGKIKTNNTDKKRIQIVFDKEVDGPLAKLICNFVHEACGYSRIDTFPLYNILVEMMTNTTQHAYKKGINGVNGWYLYAENLNDRVRFVFLDTGLGIPTTVRKNFWEKVLPLSRDCDLVKSALDGEYRTQTKLENRGKGLPQISDCFSKGLLQNVFIYSGQGCCKLTNVNKNYDLLEYNGKIFGTLFSWEILKKGEQLC